MLTDLSSESISPKYLSDKRYLWCGRAMNRMERIVFFSCLVLSSIAGLGRGCVQRGGWDISGRRPGPAGRTGPTFVRPETGGTGQRPVLPSLVSKSDDFRLIDGNNDGFVTRLEWDQAFTYLLENYDANSDGMISLSETNLENPRTHLLPSLVLSFHDFRLVDTDGNGVLTRQEWGRVFTYLVDNYDANGDGQISLSELEPSSVARLEAARL